LSTTAIYFNDGGCGGSRRTRTGIHCLGITGGSGWWRNDRTGRPKRWEIPRFRFFDPNEGRRRCGRTGSYEPDVLVLGGNRPCSDIVLGSRFLRLIVCKFPRRKVEGITLRRLECLRDDEPTQKLLFPQHQVQALRPLL
jgi:hypothetical protein